MKAAREWRDTGKILRSFFKHCLFIRSMAVKKIHFRQELREKNIREYIKKNLTPLLLIF